LSCLEDDLPTPADISVVYFRDHFDVLELAARAENSPNAEVDQNPSKSAQQSQNEKSERSIPASSLFGDEDLLQVLEKFPKVFHVLKPGVKVFTFCHSSKIQDGLPLPLRTKDNLPIRIGKSTKCSGIWGSTNVQSEKDKIVHSNPFLGNPDRKDINSQEFIPKMTEYETQGNPILLCLHGIMEKELAQTVIDWFQKFQQTPLGGMLSSEKVDTPDWEATFKDLGTHYRSHALDKGCLAAMLQRCFPFVAGWMYFPDSKKSHEIYFSTPKKHLQVRKTIEITGFRDSHNVFYPLRAKTLADLKHSAGATIPVISIQPNDAEFQQNMDFLLHSNCCRVLSFGEVNPPPGFDKGPLSTPASASNLPAPSGSMLPEEPIVDIPQTGRHEE
jgi:hypothetical protein